MAEHYEVGTILCYHRGGSVLAQSLLRTSGHDVVNLAARVQWRNVTGVNIR